MSTPYAQRRARAAAEMTRLGGPGGIAIIPTAPERPRNRDTDFLYRHDSYFYYLTGFTEPNAWLVLTADGRSTLFCQPKDLEREIWDGIRLGPEAAPAALGVDEAWSVDELDARLPKLLENTATVWYPFATHAGLEGRIDGWLQKVRARVRYGALAPEAQRDLCTILDEMRLLKDAGEQALMGRAAAIAAGAIIHFTGWVRIDPILSIFVSLLILKSTVGILRESYHFLMEGVPAQIDYLGVGADLAAVPGVLSVHDLHVWSVTSDLPALSAHLVIDDECFHDGHAPRLLDEVLVFFVPVFLGAGIRLFDRPEGGEVRLTPIPGETEYWCRVER